PTRRRIVGLERVPHRKHRRHVGSAFVDGFANGDESKIVPEATCWVEHLHGIGKRQTMFPDEARIARWSLPTSRRLRACLLDEFADVLYGMRARVVRDRRIVGVSLRQVPCRESVQGFRSKSEVGDLAEQARNT